MSDENPPKLRLRPKLAGGPPAITPAPAAPAAADSVPAPQEIVPEARPAGLRPKLALKTEDPVKPAELPRKSLPPESEAVSDEADDPHAFPPPPAKPLPPTLAPRLRPALTPAENTGAMPPFPVAANKDKLPAVLNAPPPPRLAPLPKGEETWPAVLDAPPPAGLAPTIAPLKTEEEPAEITAIRKASTFPFPSPTAKFPPLPGLGNSADSIPPESTEQEGFLKKLLLLGALAIALLVAAGFAYFKYFVAPSATPGPAPAAVAGETKDQARPAEQAAPSESAAPATLAGPTGSTPNAVVAEPAPIVPAPPPVVNTAGPATETVAAQEPVAAPEAPPVVVKPPPPLPSLAFKAWVINLKIRGVRGGEAQRVFIDKTSYVPGDVVNQQLGIMFIGYDESTRLLMFQDKSGATFERRH